MRLSPKTRRACRFRATCRKCKTQYPVPRPRTESRAVLREAAFPGHLPAIERQERARFQRSTSRPFVAQQQDTGSKIALDSKSVGLQDGGKVAEVVEVGDDRLFVNVIRYLQRRQAVPGEKQGRTAIRVPRIEIADVSNTACCRQSGSDGGIETLIIDGNVLSWRRTEYHRDRTNG